MTIASQTKSITFTAVNEGIDFGPTPRHVVGMTFQGTGLTAGHRLVVRDTATPGSGNILADYLVEAASDNADLFTGHPPQRVSGLAIDNLAVGGTWVLTATVLI
jgi:hypothetical protein